LLVLAVPALAFAKPAKASAAKGLSGKKSAGKESAKPAKEVAQVLASYRVAKAIKAKVKKTVVQETMGTSMKSEGNFYFSKGKMRLEMSEPERTVLVYDGKTIWFESRADEEHIVVTKIHGNEFHRSDSLLAALFDKSDALKQFNLKSSTTDESKKAFTFEPKDKKKSDVVSLEIALRDKDIQRIAYKDQIDNRVILEFSDVTKGSVSADKFSYKPPKGAEITEP
ncbi:MAG: LolA family protein, partial [Bdellovibrionales bacterium]